MHVSVRSVPSNPPEELCFKNHIRCVREGISVSLLGLRDCLYISPVLVHSISSVARVDLEVYLHSIVYMSSW